MGLFKTVIGGALGFMVGGPIGAAGGAILANSFGNEKYQYTISCPHCNEQLGVNEYGRFSCCKCNKHLIFSENGVIKDDRIDVICPHCNENLLIDGEGIWTCANCGKDFNYELDEKCKGYGYHEDDEDDITYLIFAQLAKFLKSDGQITKNHILVLEEIMRDKYEFDEDKRKYAINAFRQAKENNKDFEYYCLKINELFKWVEDEETVSGMKHLIIDDLYRISAIDKRISKEKNRMISFAVNIFKIEDYILEEIQNQYIDTNIERYYEILGCEDGDSLDTIKSKYRILANKYHPDKIFNKDIPDYLIQHSNEKFREIQEAYDYIKSKIEG